MLQLHYIRNLAGNPHLGEENTILERVLETGKFDYQFFKLV